MIDWLQLLPECPKCKSHDVYKLDLYRFKYDSKYKKRRQMKYKCQSCGEEFWN
jgi:transposase-like protein